MLTRNTLPSCRGPEYDGGTINAAALRPMLRQLELCGKDGRVFLEECGLSMAAVESEARVPFVQVAGLWLRAARYTNDPLIALHASMHALDMAGLPAASSCVDSLEQTCGYFRSLSPKTFCYVKGSPGSTAVIVERCSGYPAFNEEQRHAMAFMVAVLYAPLRQRDVHRRNLVQVFFPGEEPEDSGAYREFFGCDVVFGEQNAGFSVFWGDPGIDSAQSSGSSGGHPPARPSYMAEEQIGNVLERLIATSLSDGSVSLEHLARKLAMSPRTLQRRLKEEGTTHRVLVERVRCERAHELLGTTEVPIAEIAKHLGFGDTVAFHKAFRRWTGLTPGRYRGLVALSARPLGNAPASSAFLR